MGGGFISAELRKELEALLSRDAKLQFVEPHDTGGDCVVTLTAKQAASWMKKTHPGVYKDDVLALDEFMVVHWATAKEVKK